MSFNFLENANISNSISKMAAVPNMTLGLEIIIS